MTQKKNEFFTLKHDKEKGFKGHHLEFFLHSHCLFILMPGVKKRDYNGHLS